MQKQVEKRASRVWAISAPEVLANAVQMSEITGLPKWLCRNVLVWRARKGLSITVAKAVE